MRVRARALLPAAALLGIALLTQAGSADFHVYLECSSDTYALGDSVRFVWRNDTDSTTTAGYRPPYDIYTLDNELVYFGIYPAEYPLGPHAAVDLAWDQLDWMGTPVPPGVYSVRIYYVFNDAPPGYVVADDFLIQAPASAPEDDPQTETASWGAVKASFR